MINPMGWADEKARTGSGAGEIRSLRGRFGGSARLVVDRIATELARVLGGFLGAVVGWD